MLYKVCCGVECAAAPRPRNFCDGRLCTVAMFLFDFLDTGVKRDHLVAHYCSHFVVTELCNWSFSVH